LLTAQPHGRGRRLSDGREIPSLYPIAQETPVPLIPQ
jgi:hypothetical protein